MKAPDKIYLERDKETNKIHHLWGRDAVISSFYEHIEYIRKEALLEWIEKEIQALSDGSLSGYYISLAYKDMIEHLNEM